MSTPFYEKYRQLCTELGKSDSAVAAEIGLSNSTVTTWRQGAIPRRPTLKRVADYFGVSVEEMMGYSGIEKTPTSDGERNAVQTEDEEDMLLLARHMAPIPEDDRKQLKEQFRKSIDLYLKARGLSEMEDK